jgi:CubicO group peptidase (beta-lactamase class C family)
VQKLHESEVDEFVQRVLSRWQIPGLALAVLAEPNVSLAKAYGLREIGGNDLVTPDTVFTIGSLTKAFTAAALALLVDAGRIGWDHPVRRYIPDFALADGWLSEHVTVRDLLAHRVGWEEHYWFNFANRLHLTRTEIVRSLRTARVSNDFRARFVYSNLMYVAAGEIIPAVTGQSWDDFVKDHLLRPLSMNSTSTSARQLLNAPNHACPHVRDRTGQLRSDPLLVDAWWTMDNHGASGSINSTAVDLISWMKFHLPRSYSGPRPLTERTLAEVHSPHTLVGSFENDEAILNLGYGLGWQIATYRGRRCSYHEGAFRGMSAYIIIFHELGCGVAVLANSRDAVKGNVTRAVGEWLSDRVLGAPRHDWERASRGRYDAQKQSREELERTWVSRRRSDVTPLPLCKYEGIYSDPPYTSWVVELDAGELIIRSPTGVYSARLEHWNDDVFVSYWNDHLIDYWPARFVQFALGADGMPGSCHFCSDPHIVISTFRKNPATNSIS